MLTRVLLLFLLLSLVAVASTRPMKDGFPSKRWTGYISKKELEGKTQKEVEELRKKLIKCK